MIEESLIYFFLFLFSWLIPLKCIFILYKFVFLFLLNFLEKSVLFHAGKWILYLKRFEINKEVPDIEANSKFLFSNNFEFKKVTDWQFDTGLRNAQIMSNITDSFILNVHFLEIINLNENSEIKEQFCLCSNNIRYVFVLKIVDVLFEETRHTIFKIQMVLVWMSVCDSQQKTKTIKTLFFPQYFFWTRTLFKEQLLLYAYFFIYNSRSVFLNILL